MRIKSSQEAWSQYGGLGPDLDNDEVMSKRAALLRAKHFSVQLREVNRDKVNSDLNSSKVECIQFKQVSNRERANAFARTIVKPKPRLSSNFVEADDSHRKENDESDVLSELFRRHRELQLEVIDLKARYA